MKNKTQEILVLPYPTGQMTANSDKEIMEMAAKMKSEIDDSFLASCGHILKNAQFTFPEIAKLCRVPVNTVHQLRASRIRGYTR